VQIVPTLVLVDR